MWVMFCFLFTCICICMFSFVLVLFLFLLFLLLLVPRTPFFFFSFFPGFLFFFSYFFFLFSWNIFLLFLIYLFYHLPLIFDLLSFPFFLFFSSFFPVFPLLSLSFPFSICFRVSRSETFRSLSLAFDFVLGGASTSLRNSSVSGDTLKLLKATHSIFFLCLSVKEARWSVAYGTSTLGMPFHAAEHASCLCCCHFSRSTLPIPRHAKRLQQ